jgi:hypothetical protein
VLVVVVGCQVDGLLIQWSVVASEFDFAVPI